MKPIAADEIRDVWAQVLPGLQEVRDRCKEVWLPEDVYASLRAGNSFLYLVDGGFVIFQRHTDFDGPVLFVWIIWGDLFATHLDICAEIEGMARAMKAKRIRMHSPRKGWAKLDFFAAKSTVYERELI